MTIRLLFALLVALLGLGALAAPSPEPWARWQTHDAGSVRRIDHGELDAFLMRYLRIGADGVHRLAYGEVSPDDRALLDRYLATAGSVPISDFDRAEQMAFWINLYNALTIRLVLDHYPVGSIRDIAAGRGPREGGAADGRRVEVEGVALSLADIEHRILRPIWRDPRVHYALSCGAIGCPNLQPEPYRGDRLEHQLNKAAMDYVNDPRCLRIDGQLLAVSSIYRWYRDDFGGSDRTVINHLLAYAAPALAMELQRFDRIDADMFDWRLNDAGP